MAGSRIRDGAERVQVHDAKRTLATVRRGDLSALVGWRVLACWAFLVLFPALLGGVRAPSGESSTRVLLERLYGLDVAQYWAHASRALVIYALTSLAFCSIFAVFLLIWAQRMSSPGVAEFRTKWLDTGAAIARALLAWAILETFGVSIVVALHAVTGAPPLAESWSWAWRLALVLIGSAIAPVGILAVPALTISSKTRRMIASIAVAAAVGGWGIATAAAQPPIAPRAIDRALLSGAPGVPWGALLVAGAWLLAGSLFAAFVQSRGSSLPAGGRPKRALSAKKRLARD